ncbi:MAG: lysophospholipase [Gammaproteobacteria bacterium]|nr:lysophospholipase [Gammaproteobacteria bacterium]
MKTILWFMLCLSHWSVYAAEVSRTEQGRQLVANLELAEGKHLQDGVVLMTHGTLAHGQMEIMTSLQGLLKESGINSLSINLSLGLDDRHGMYDCTVSHTHKHQDAMQEIDGWLGWLKSQHAGPVTLLGHSRGGNQTAWYASEHSSAAFDKVVLIAPATWSESKDIKGYEKRYKKSLAPILKQAHSLLKQGKGSQMMPHTDFIYCADTSVTAEAFVSYYQPDPRMHTPTLLSKINKPVIVFAGSEDKVVQGLAEAVRPLVDGKKIQLVEIDGADHFFRDLYAEEVTEAMIEFMGQ